MNIADYIARIQAEHPNITPGGNQAWRDRSWMNNINSAPIVNGVDFGAYVQQLIDGFQTPNVNVADRLPGDIPGIDRPQMPQIGDNRPPHVRVPHGVKADRPDKPAIVPGSRNPRRGGLSLGGVPVNPGTPIPTEPLTPGNFVPAFRPRMQSILDVMAARRANAHSGGFNRSMTANTRPQHSFGGGANDY